MRLNIVDLRHKLRLFLSTERMVRPKKRLGQHFLKDKEVALKITDSLTGFGDYREVLEIGPGTGMLTQFLLNQSKWIVWMIEVDTESIEYLKGRYPGESKRIIEADFLNWKGTSMLSSTFALIGNFPYNISSQIFFRVLELREQIPEVVCMLQKEVAQRLVSPPGNKAYGILSVFLQAFYKLEYLFEVPPQSFYPKPKVHSAVIRLQTLGNYRLDCDEQIFRTLVKRGFQNRRKTLRNALKALNLPQEIHTTRVL